MNELRHVKSVPWGEKVKNTVDYGCLCWQETVNTTLSFSVSNLSNYLPIIMMLNMAGGQNHIKTMCAFFFFPFIYLLIYPRCSAKWLTREATFYGSTVFTNRFVDFRQWVFSPVPYRLQAEQERLEKIGSIAYYSEWVQAWDRDTSREAVQKHFEETGEDENTQLIEMFQHQTDREYRIMMGTDIRIQRDPLAMRMREDQIKQSIYFKADKFVHYFHFFHCSNNAV